MNKQSRKPTNLSLDASLLTEARALNVNLSRAAEAGLRDAVALARAAQWKVDNARALQSSNAHVDAHGLPLADLRPF